MILLVHHNGRIKTILHDGEVLEAVTPTGDMARNLFEVARVFPEQLVLWCEQRYEAQLNYTQLENIFYHRRILCSFSVSNKQFISDRIGYIESTPFININYDQRYPTWLMSSDVGGVHASVLNAVNESQFRNKDFEYVLNSLAKSVISLGVFCYSEPGLLNTKADIKESKKEITPPKLFRFVRQHYKTHWVFLLFGAIVFFEGKVLLYSLIQALFYRRKKPSSTAITQLAFNTSNSVVSSGTYDVLIPTIGRKQYLYDFLKDLSVQTVLPTNVIIIEQNPDFDSISDLDYLDNETWPFNVVHRFIHETGACRARNIGFSLVKSEWLLLGDDDIRVEEALCENMLKYAKEYGTNVLTASCLKPGETQTYLLPGQTTIFGSGSSLVKSSLLQKVSFDTRYEFGFAEDIDFGMQLRNIGEDIIYCPHVKITHLKAAVGGFRTKFKLPWEDDPVHPLPSPTVLLYNLKHRTKKQILGYKMLYFIRYYKNQSVKNPFRYLKNMRIHWNHSMDWAMRLLENEL